MTFTSLAAALRLMLMSRPRVKPLRGNIALAAADPVTVRNVVGVFTTKAAIVKTRPVCYAKVQLKVLSQSWQVILKEQIICHQKPYSTKMQHYTKN